MANPKSTLVTLVAVYAALVFIFQTTSALRLLVSSKEQIECTKCSACDNPCNPPVYSPPPPLPSPPPPSLSPPPPSTASNYCPPPPSPPSSPSSGNYYYSPPLPPYQPGYNVYAPPLPYYGGYGGPPPPNPIVPYFPYYYRNPPTSFEGSSSFKFEHHQHPIVSAMVILIITLVIS